MKGGYKSNNGECYYYTSIIISIIKGLLADTPILSSDITESKIM